MTRSSVSYAHGVVPTDSPHDQDETFFVLDGELTIQLRTGDVHLRAGELFVIPRTVEHCPVATVEAKFLLIGPTAMSTAAGGKAGLESWRSRACCRIAQLSSPEAKR